MVRRSIQDYQDILDLPHHVSRTRPHMSMHDRATQFSPFAALTGYDAVLKEAAQQNDARFQQTLHIFAQADPEAAEEQ
ncbi:MAG: hypothetical protein LIO67_05415 [Lachnospiraceae bacterium]|nr:hypothetical protein [Lachnospiraceae bacterium]